MILIAAVDDNYGLMFNNRRQSQDRVLREYILRVIDDRCLWMNSYTREQFTEMPVMSQISQIRVDESFLEKVPIGDFCFVENCSVLPYENSIEKILLFRWNRRYPADLYFDIRLETGWRLISSDEFAGYSHDRITMEVYGR